MFVTLIFSVKIGHRDFNPLMGVCECIVDKEVVCQSDEQVCVTRRSRDGFDHTHTVKSVRCGTSIDDAVPVSMLPLTPRLREMFKSEQQCHNNLGD